MHSLGNFVEALLQFQAEASFIDKRHDKVFSDNNGACYLPLFLTLSPTLPLFHSHSDLLSSFLCQCDRCRWETAKETRVEGGN